MDEATTPITVLNVNDSPANLYTTSRMLMRGGFHVLEAVDGRSALELAQGLPDVILLDVNLPDMSGLDVCRRLKESEVTAHCSILMTSAHHVSAESKVLGLDQGADGYLAQPFESEELLAMVKSLLRLRRAEQLSRERNDRLLEADRHKDEFVAMLAHELRNPLAAATMALQLLNLQPPDPAREQRSREVIGRQLGNLARLIDDLLDVSRVTRGKIELRTETVEFGALVQRTAAVARDRWMTPRGQELSVTIPDAPVFVAGDSMRLEQVLNNLLDNASKYSEAGGHVALRLSTDAKEGNCTLLVRDDGLGLAPASTSKVFVLFFQADQALGRARSGLGIGLTLVRTLVELHGGTVTARSEGIGLGSEFRVRLPLVADARIERVRPPALLRLAARRVLIIDDLPDLRETLCELCRSWGHLVESASDGLAGVEKALETKPDFALIDIGLPGIDGYEVARRIRADSRGREIKLIALTGYGAAEQRARALSGGFDQYLVKPVDSQLLEKLLQAPATKLLVEAI